MKKYCFIILIAFVTVINAQITTGSLVLEIADASMEKEEGAHFGGMMKGMTMTMHFTPEKQMTDIRMNMMGMDMSIKQFHDNGTMTQFMDMMGQKIKVVSGMEALQKSGADMEALQEAYSVSYDKSDTKIILGYKCHRANITMEMKSVLGEAEMPDGMQNMSLIAYVTEDIKINQFSLEQFKGLHLDGTPLLMIMNMGMMRMTYTAISFDKDIDPKVFEYPTGEYKEMPIDDMQKMGMGGSGFGF
ncbi:MAG: hypothetical protein ACJA01_004505 [Saprospiraceae bacterium]|jgi:hypothetical protein